MCVDAIAVSEYYLDATAVSDCYSANTTCIRLSVATMTVSDCVDATTVMC